jgi:hypothetical protein
MFQQIVTVRNDIVDACSFYRRDTQATDTSKPLSSAILVGLTHDVSMWQCIRSPCALILAFPSGFCSIEFTVRFIAMKFVVIYISFAQGHKFDDGFVDYKM